MKKIVYNVSIDPVEGGFLCKIQTPINKDKRKIIASSATFFAETMREGLFRVYKFSCEIYGETVIEETNLPISKEP